MESTIMPLEKSELEYKIFVSYLRKDTPELLAIVNTLNQLPNLQIKYDKLIRTGRIWSKEIKKYIEEADLIIAIISDQTCSSPAIQEELSIAHKLQKGIIPILIKNGSELPSRLDFIECLQGIVCERENFDQAINKLIEDLDTRMKELMLPSPIKLGPFLYAKDRTNLTLTSTYPFRLKSILQRTKINSQILALGRTLISWFNQENLISNAILKRNVKFNFLLLDKSCPHFHILSNYEQVILKQDIELAHKLAINLKNQFQNQIAIRVTNYLILESMSFFELDIDDKLMMMDIKVENPYLKPCLALRSSNDPDIFNALFLRAQLIWNSARQI